MNYQKLQGLALAGNVKHIITGPHNLGYRILYGHAILACDANPADRRFKFTLYDENSKVVIDTHAGAVAVANETRHYALYQGIYRETSFVDNDIEVPIPQDFIIPPFYRLEVEIVNGQAGDVWEVTLAADAQAVSRFQV